MYMSILSKGQAQLGFLGLCTSQNGEKVCLAALGFLAEYASKFQDNYISIDNKSNTQRNLLPICMTGNTISPRVICFITLDAGFFFILMN